MLFLRMMKCVVMFVLGALVADESFIPCSLALSNSQRQEERPKQISFQEDPMQTLSVSPYRGRPTKRDAHIFRALIDLGAKLLRKGKEGWKRFTTQFKKGKEQVMAALTSKTGRMVTNGLKYASTAVSLVCCTSVSIAAPPAGLACCASTKIVKGAIAGVSLAQRLAMLAKTAQNNKRKYRSISTKGSQAYRGSAKGNELHHGSMQRPYKSPLCDAEYLVSRSPVDLAGLHTAVTDLHTVHRICGGFAGHAEVTMKRALALAESAFSLKGTAEHRLRNGAHTSHKRAPLSHSARVKLSRQARFEIGPLRSGTPKQGANSSCWRLEVGIADMLQQRLAKKLVTLLSMMQ